MAITILPPAPVVDREADSSDYSDSDDGGVDLDGDIDMRPKKRPRHNGSSSIVTPGEVVTDDKQWMRYAASIF
jgi:exosome complex component RRP4